MTCVAAHSVTMRRYTTATTMFLASDIRFFIRFLWSRGDIKGAKICL